eukprot:TRINITY_DN3489_c0_g1_i1.p1 TRINITY_DN3489_c0_g1~~TRINITY_DN3489_c0_g1_i1.p1  ORF type:complete len:304 (+),score=44.40 TRINITY_DN3489_c0_g1_i1:246-1157(+)
MTSGLEITVLPHRIFMVRVDKEMLGFCTKALLRLLFYPDSSSFFSYTETDDETSLFLNEESLMYMKENIGSHVDLVQSPECWRAVQIFEGASSIDLTGLVASLSAPLTRLGIEMVYLSTFESDLILVSEENLEKASTCLRERIAQNPDFKAFKQETANEEQMILFSPLNAKLALVAFKSMAEMKHSAVALLEQFLFYKKSESQNRFFSFTAPPTAITMVIEHEVASMFGDALNVHADRWSAIQVLGEGSTGFSETNVSTLSAILAEAGISIYYLSTFNSDFILVPEKQMESALTCLNAKFKSQ